MVKNSQFIGIVAGIFVISGTLPADYKPPAGEKPAFRGKNGSSILPGGRVIQPLGTQLPTGPGPAKLVSSPSGNRVATANLGPERTSVTLLERDRKGEWTLRSFPTAISGGIAFAGEKSLWISEGSTGEVRLLDVESGATRKRLALNRDNLSGSFSGDLALDAVRNLLFVADTAHSRVVLFDAHSYQQVAEIAAGTHPRALSLAPDGKRLYVLSTDSLAVIDVTVAPAPKMAAILPVADGGEVTATGNAVFISSPHEDSITVIDPASNVITATIPLRIPGLESVRGIQPRGMAFDNSRHWLLVAEAGINAIAVMEPATGHVLGHLPVGWFPTSLVAANGSAMVANALGRGTGPSSMWLQPDALEFEGVFRRGSISRFELPSAEELAKPTRLVLATNGFLRSADPPRADIPVHHVLLILKGNRTFDDILGDLKVPGATVEGLPQLAHFGNEGYADGGRKRFSLQQIPITPNHHALALRFSSSDNFYADADESADGLSQHLERNHISFLEFGEAFDHNTSDQSRAARFLSELDEKYKKTGKALPQLMVLHLPNDQTAPPQPKDGFPYAASYAADNDLSLGRVIDSLSHSPWWRDMAVFVTEADAQGGRDHVDSHRTVFLGAGPWFRKGYVSHENADFAAILKATFHLLGAPSWKLSDASAADLNGLFTTDPDFAPYDATPVDPRLLESHP